MVYYVCDPHRNGGIDSKSETVHRSRIWLRESAVLPGLLQFIEEHVFGPNRRTLLAEQLAGLDLEASNAARDRLVRIEREVERLNAANERLIRSLEEEDDPYGSFGRGVRDRVRQNEQSLRELLHRREEAEQESDRSPSASTQALLDALPLVSGRLVELPDSALRELFESLEVSVRYDDRRRVADCEVLLSEVAVEGLGAPMSGVPSAGIEPAAYCSGGSRSIP